MKLSDFDLITHLVTERTGMPVPRERAYILERQMASVARRHGLRCAEEMGPALGAGHYPELVEELSDALTVKPSAFFKERAQLDQFRDIVLPYLVKHRAAEQRLRIWVAGCGRGQEAYSIAMCLKDSELDLADWSIEIVASDHSSTAIRAAETGRYSQIDVQQGLRIQQLIKHFHQQGDAWQVNDKLRAMIRFTPHGLLDSVEALGRFDVVFCRNVLGHMDPEIRDDVSDHLAQAMAPDGFLYLAPGDGLPGTFGRLRSLPSWPGLYRTVEDQPGGVEGLAG